MTDELPPIPPDATPAKDTKGPFRFAWRRGMGGAYPVKVGLDMWPTFMKPDGNKANAPHIVQNKFWDLNEVQCAMTLDELAGIFPCPGGH